VPDLRNQSIYFAKLMAQKLDSTISRASIIPSSTYKKGRVISQSPKSETEMPSRTGVSVLLSDGPARKWYVMPDVQGSPFATAKSLFEKKGFRIVSKYKYNAHMLPNEVIRQIPQPGYPVREKSTITLEVNRLK
jgi:serine/threonine-protein kinase